MSSSAASVLVEPLDAYLLRRARSTLALTPGEAVTAAVALLRGCRSPAARGEGARWWLRADGCPVVVAEDGPDDTISATADALERVAELTDGPATREMVERARESLLTEPPRAWDRFERRLFAFADPVPLVLGPLAPVDENVAEVVDEPRAGAASRALSLVDADFGDAVHGALRELRVRWSSSRGLRLSVVGGAVVAVVVAAAALLLPPSGQPDASVMPGPAVTTPTDSTFAEEGRSPRPEPTVGEALPGGLVADARALFADIETCAGEPSCVSGYYEDSGFPQEPLLEQTLDAEIAPLDDFGGVGVVRLTRAERTQYVTLVRQKDRWLVRAVRTVADQPS
ncbi:hypothetical protein [uncultured Microbacterium sp.]|uniref:hypothetical protein n=1 Tax=uncultured Microbacterium sp. TaxID=191216 RepID=UPI0025EDD09B|nr:hypothetical protein [uncultured Microbacterium sp.]